VTKAMAISRGGTDRGPAAAAALSPVVEAVRPMCSDLSLLAHGRYKLILEESWYHEVPEVRGPDKHWYLQIPCKGGAFIGLYAEAPETILHLYTPRVKNARIIWEQLKNQPGCRADFHMDGEAELYFPPELLHQVAEMAGARIKRRLSPEARLKVAERGRAALEKYRKTNYQGENLPQISPVQVR
jgi:hypothetical protein